MLVMFECTVVGQRLRNLRELRSLSTPKQAVQVYRHGKWDRLPGDALLPGDLISLGRPAGGARLAQTEAFKPVRQMDREALASGPLAGRCPAAQQLQIPHRQQGGVCSS